MRARPLLAVAAATLVAVAATPASAHDKGCAGPSAGGGQWPSQGNGVLSNRTQPAERIIDAVAAATLQPAWTFDANRWTHGTNNEVTGYPIVVDGCVFVGSSTGNAADGAHLPGWVFALNAEDGDVVWQTRVDGGVYSTVAVDNGVVYAFVSRVGSPYVVALDQHTGEVLWETIVDRQPGSDAVASPIVYDGMVWVGVSGTAAEGGEADRNAFQGSSVLIAAQPIEAPRFEPVHAPAPSGTRVFEPGEVIRKAYSIPPSEWAKGFAGGAQWGTISIDPKTGYGYTGTGNPFNYDSEHGNTNAVLKLDLDRSRATFGRYVGTYKGDVEEYFPGATSTTNEVCETTEVVPGIESMGVECARLDLDFGITPNIYTDGNGRRIVAAGQKSGVLHFIDAATMQRVGSTLLGVPSPVGGIVGPTAYDGTSIYGPHTIGGYLWSVNATTRSLNWLTPTLDGVHWGPPVTAANNVLYSVDLKGFLTAFDALTGLPLLQLPMTLGSETRENPTLSWGGVTVAEHKVFASVGVGLSSANLPSMPNGFVIAYEPASLPVR
jgi:polyvinyl alcohol dehydrogenase (cytochrome)